MYIVVDSALAQSEFNLPRSALRHYENYQRDCIASLCFSPCYRKIAPFIGIHCCPRSAARSAVFTRAATHQSDEERNDCRLPVSN